MSACLGVSLLCLWVLVSSTYLKVLIHVICDSTGLIIVLVMDPF